VELGGRRSQSGRHTYSLSVGTLILYSDGVLRYRNESRACPIAKPSSFFSSLFALFSFLFPSINRRTKSRATPEFLNFKEMVMHSEFTKTQRVNIIFIFSYRCAGELNRKLVKSIMMVSFSFLKFSISIENSFCKVQTGLQYFEYPEQRIRMDLIIVLFIDISP